MMMERNEIPITRLRIREILRDRSRGRSQQGIQREMRWEDRDSITVSTTTNSYVIDREDGPGRVTYVRIQERQEREWMGIWSQS